MKELRLGGERAAAAVTPQMHRLPQQPRPIACESPPAGGGCADMPCAVVAVCHVSSLLQPQPLEELLHCTRVKKKIIVQNWFQACLVPVG